MSVEPVIRQVTKKNVSERRERQYEKVSFPCAEEDLLDLFKVEDISELVFSDKKDTKVSVSNFNRIMHIAEDRMELIESQINAIVKYLMKQLKAHPEWKGTRDNANLSFDSLMVWHYCMRKNYKHKDPHVKVWVYNGELCISYTTDNES